MIKIKYFIFILLLLCTFFISFYIVSNFTDKKIVKNSKIAVKNQEKIKPKKITKKITEKIEEKKDNRFFFEKTSFQVLTSATSVISSYILFIFITLKKKELDIKSDTSCNKIILFLALWWLSNAFASFFAYIITFLGAFIGIFFKESEGFSRNLQLCNRNRKILKYWAIAIFINSIIVATLCYFVITTKFLSCLNLKQENDLP